MHDPSTLAFEIHSPIKRKSQFFPEGFRNTLVYIWHRDPEKDGTDDSCGWFMRAKHGDKEVLERIIKRFEFDWDRIFTSESGTVYFSGLFCPNGDPHLSVHGIVLNLFFTAALEVFGNRDKAVSFLQKHLFEILFFAENPVDSLYDGITRKFEIGCGEAHTKQQRTERIRSMATCIYGWILRETRPWYKHPRWHIHHWRIQIPIFQKLRRFMLQRCCICNGRFGFNESPISDWSGTRIWHQHCDNNLKQQSSNPA